MSLAYIHQSCSKQDVGNQNIIANYWRFADVLFFSMLNSSIIYYLIYGKLPITCCLCDNSYVGFKKWYDRKCVQNSRYFLCESSWNINDTICTIRTGRPSKIIFLQAQKNDCNLNTRLAVVSLQWVKLNRKYLTVVCTKPEQLTK